MRGNISHITIHHQVFEMIDGTNMIPVGSGIPQKTIRIVANDNDELKQMIMGLYEEIDKYVEQCSK
jgi:hypothetical protein